MTNYTTLGGHVTCTQCNALSKRTRQRCKAPAIKGKTKCRFHGGKSTGSRTAEGRARIAKAHTVHGRETRAKRAERSAKLAELYELEILGRSIGMFEGRMVGRKPRGRG
ncbi:MAG: HGGxSTG domain-containing protein [Pseudohongiellaceae bacterium]